MNYGFEELLLCYYAIKWYIIIMLLLWVSIILWKIYRKYGFEEKNHGLETKYRFASNKKDGCSLNNERFSRSMDLQKNDGYS